MRVAKIDDQFSVIGQITPDQIAEISAAGFRAIVCARPDNEEGGQPSFDSVAREAEKHGCRSFTFPSPACWARGRSSASTRRWSRCRAPSSATAAPAPAPAASTPR